MPSYVGHVPLYGEYAWLIVGACVSEAGTRAEREAALRLLDEAGGKRPRSLGADKQYQEREFVAALRQRGIAARGQHEKGQLRVRNSLREGTRQCGICAQPAETKISGAKFLA